VTYAAGVPDRFTLNTAQLRNLRNWSAAERPHRTLRVAVSPPDPIPPGPAERAVRELVRRHEALRSRLVDDRWQEVSGDVTLPMTDEVEPVLVDPAEHAARYRFHVDDGQVTAVELIVSHVFVDALGLRALARDLRVLLAGDRLDSRPAQARDFARGPHDPDVLANTAHWRGLLTGMPRSCTYAGVARAEYEPVSVARVPLDVTEQEAVSAACRQLRMTPSALWAAAVSIVVSRLCGQHRQIFRTTYANRFTRAEFGAAAQLAQAVFVPVRGSATDTMRARATGVASTLLSTYDKGVLDVNALLEWLNDPVRAAGVLFGPSFELNYVPRLPDDQVPTTPAPAASEAFTETGVRVDPPSAKADLVVLITHTPDPVVRLSARRPVSAQRSALALVEDCLSAVRALCEEPDAQVTEVPVDPLPAADELWRGHHSGVALDLAGTRELVESVAGVDSCALEPSDTGLIHAVVTGRIEPGELRRVLWERQPWHSGTAVPDELTVVPASQPKST
jgi:hypothetical protein